MSLLIKGMEMPPDCRVCPFEMYYINSGKTRCGAAKRTLAENFKTIPFVGRADFCPLIELPPHGRLIDADALAKDYDGFPVRIDPWVWNELSHAPTIIEAEPTQSNASNTLDALTNADRIRAMSDEELAEFFVEAYWHVCKADVPDDPETGECVLPSCKQCFSDWLKQEVTE